MKCDCILAGVGGQGVLSIAAIIARAAAAEGLAVRQSEVHGMAQRGGAVLAHLRLADGNIAGDLVPKGRADLIISMEPLESLRYLSWLSPGGALVTAAEPVVNIPDYPELAEVHAAVKNLPRHSLVDAAALAKEAGLARAVNMVMVGAASPYLPVKAEVLEKTIEAVFAAKDPSMAGLNRLAFRKGRGDG
ncbi:MAG: indolepyruvate oxidoreductase subunit beta [Spirochaetaceae bacterium]|jgi:indolepyruvate ferredoxin oxidoreductase beta subunit|nr:indolepyruvate oxidoreductase subunit beta [Spirochaetaceae bacterium]